jgi:hypothetical protein
MHLRLGEECDVLRLIPIEARNTCEAGLMT